jgi:hypothetical protein
VATAGTGVPSGGCCSAGIGADARAISPSILSEAVLMRCALLCLRLRTGGLLLILVVPSARVITRRDACPSR